MIVRNKTAIKASGLLIALSVALSGCSTADVKNLVSDGNAMSTTQIKSASTNPQNVKLFYAGNKNPKYYTVVGRVSAENYNIVGIEHAQSSVAEELKKQAASIGANGVINITQGLAQTTGDAILLR
ncbi:hypothetical protein AYO45_01985 [Gammaproteobacteria bacterium SCGC AG-212-F23]|nr:hypothetical protein AYO45_01985 [Gammaproteobacteria bacterium SCGC AG-212-F23]